MTLPGVSVIVPCYNEELTVQLLLEALSQQLYPLQKLEVIIVDGMSTDKTRQVVELYYNQHPELAIRIIDNPKRIIPAALNCGVNAASKEIILRLDAHSKPYPDYIEKSIQALQSGRGDNVGGIWEIQPFHQTGESASPVARGIAAAAAHPLGVGDAFYRYASEARQVDTVPFGAFRKSLAMKIGLFNESLLTNEDYEFNIRIQQNGGKIWLDPAIRCIYFARSTYTALAQQYWRYGYWKARMLLRFPKTIRWRQALPPLFVLVFAFLAGISIWALWARFLLLLQISSYLIILMGIGLITAVKKNDGALISSMPLAIATMHIAWGSAFIWSLLGSFLGNLKQTKTFI